MATDAKCRVLVVDDDQDTAFTLRMLLEFRGYDARACHRPQDCMAIIEEFRPDILLLDLAMPGMSGFDIARELQRRPDLRPSLLIAVSGYGQTSAVEMTKATGFDHHCLKPVRIDDLDALLKKAECNELV